MFKVSQPQKNLEAYTSLWLNCIPTKKPLVMAIEDN